MLVPSLLLLTDPLGPQLPFSDGLLANRRASGEVMAAGTVQKTKQNNSLFTCFKMKHR